MIALGVFSASIAWGILGFIAGMYIAYLMGLHEKLHVMPIGFSMAVIMALLGSRTSRKIISITPQKLKVIALLLFIMAGPVCLWLLFHFVGY